MKIHQGAYIGTLDMPVLNLAIDILDDGLEFSNVYPLGIDEQYSGKRWEKDGQAYGLIHTLRFDCSDLQGNAQWGDVASWHIYKADLGPLFIENLHANTYASKASSGMYANAMSRLPVAVLFVPWASSTLDDVSVFLQLGDGSNVIVGEGLELSAFEGSAATWRAQQMPSVSLSGPDQLAANDTGLFTVVVSRDGGIDSACNAEVCIETTGGYLPMQRTRAAAGQAAFRLQTLGLEPGESIKLKVGFRNYSALANKTVHIA